MLHNVDTIILILQIREQRDIKKSEQLAQNLLDKMEDSKIWIRAIWPQSPGF